ncbi:MAG: sodium:proton antiporter [Clostridiales bacterium]|nr:sodium:proton antiporter [Clostridiales bacterium]
MNGNILLPLAALLPMLAAPFVWHLGSKNKQSGLNGMSLVCLLQLILATVIGFEMLQGKEMAFELAGFCGQGLRMRADGFRSLYALVACGMWFISGVFSRDYLAHEHAVARYCFFTLMTLGAVCGMFYADSLFSIFIFFEIMSLASYPWVAHEEDKAAMRAGETYLYIAVIGGLTMLMGIFLLPQGMAAASLGDLPALASGQNLWLSAILMLVGFGAKAGAFPLHIWLPKAHPVAPAPASALLSGLLTKAGVFGILILSTLVMREVSGFGDLLFRLGVITMLLGAVLAIFSLNLKRTLACSSLSQIGFILIGAGLCNLLGEHNGLALYGTIGHMVNHSLFKLVLFLCAGVLAMNTHQLELRDVQGYGRNKPFLHVCFLLGVVGIAGVPGFSGFLSKSLLHEGIVELIAHLAEHGHATGIYKVSEWLFLLAGGMTLCYMLKLYFCLFWMKNDQYQQDYDQKGSYLSLPARIALGFAAALIPVIGLFPGQTMSRLGALSQSFLQGGVPAHLPIPYFSFENLKGAAISLVIGLCLFGLLLLSRKAGLRKKIPFRFDLEDMVYRPLIGLLITIGGGFASLCDKLMDWLTALLKGTGGITAKVLDSAVDHTAALAGRTAFQPVHEHETVPVGNRTTYTLGTWMDRAAKLFHGGKESEHSFVTSLAALWEEWTGRWRQMARSVSYGLVLFCLGLMMTLVYLLW